MLHSVPVVGQFVSKAQKFTSGAIMTSTLVETVSINFEDFSESFLTCSTCLCPFDSVERNPKLLACSHTVCRTCLERIAGLPQSRDTGSFRCPICRESIAVPRSGVSAFPPSFLVNQLIDLMQRQRKEIVARCSVHPEELLFCETCDLVFCPCCVGVEHVEQASKSCEHTVVPFSIAMKRMSEILLYKAQNCVKALNRASENVANEMDLIDRNVESVINQVDQSFQEFSQRLEKRRRQLVEELGTIREDKRRILHDQLLIIQAEKAKVEEDCNGLEYQVDIRSITRKISALNIKLDVSNTLLEPRENAFLRYKYNPTDVISALSTALGCLGGLTVSKTFPPLCTALIIEPVCAFLPNTALLTTIDYHGCLRTTGGDPAEVSFWKDAVGAGQATAKFTGRSKDDVKGKADNSVVSLKIDDVGDGSYVITFKTMEAGQYKLDIRIFGRSIKHSPITVNVSPHINPIWCWGQYGTDDYSLCQPVRVLCDAKGQLLILDTGNNRVKLCTNSGEFIRHIIGHALDGQSAIGMAIHSDTNMLYIINWRTKTVTQWCINDCTMCNSCVCEQFAEPIDIAIDEQSNRLFVADNAQCGTVFVFDAHKLSFVTAIKLSQPPAKVLSSVFVHNEQSGKKGQSISNNVSCFDISCIVIGRNEEILIGGRVGICVYNMQGAFLRLIDVFGAFYSNGVCSDGQLLNSSPYGRPSTLQRHHNRSASTFSVGGIALDSDGYVLATVTGSGERQQNVSFVSVSTYNGVYLFSIDSDSSKLRRPSGICLLSDQSHVIIADLGNHCVKKYRYK